MEIKQIEDTGLLLLTVYFFSSFKIRYTKYEILDLIIRPLGKHLDSKNITGMSTLV